jgi:DNA-binding GntR family transcriptional regulator
MFIANNTGTQYSFLETTTLSRELPKAAQIYNILRSAIINLRLPPGALVKKEVIAKKLKVSRTPVSDAISRLEENGLLEVFPQHGTFVSKILESDVRQGAFLRKALEVAAAREVAKRATLEQIELLHKNIRYQESALSAGDLDDFHAHDEEFHKLICEFTGYPRLRRLVDGSRGQLDRVRMLLLPDTTRPLETIKEHKKIASAIKAHDPDAAARAIEEHLDKTPNKLERLIQQRPELFDS